MRLRLLLALATGVILLPLAHAADWPQWRGPDRSGVSKETGLLKEWPKEGPKLTWTCKVLGAGYSGPAVVGGKVFIMGTRDKEEVLFCLDDKGTVLWTAKIGPIFDFRTNQWSGGPNATPTVDEGHVYALGSQGSLICADAAKGTIVWQKDLSRDMEAEVNPVGGGPEKMGWGFCWSPLVDGKQLVIVPGGPKGLLAALDRKTGAELWRSKEVTEQATYSSPVLFEVDGSRQYVQVTQKGVVGVDATDGKLLWSHDRDDPFPDCVCITPIVQGNKIYTTEWGASAEVLEVTGKDKKFTAKPVWSEKEISNIQGGVVLVGGEVYGFHADRAWECQDFATGSLKPWKSIRTAPKAGTIIAADGMLYCVSQKEGKGDVALVQADPAKYKIKGRFSLPEASAIRKRSGGVWTPAVLSDGKLYLRDQEFLFCYEVK